MDLVNNDAYHADCSAVGNSMLKVFMESRREYEARYVTRTIASPDPSDSMRLGSLSHAMLLDEAELKNFALIPTDVLASNGARLGNKWKEYEAANADKTLVTIKENQTAFEMCQSVRAKCGPWFAGVGKAEQAIFWTDSETGIRCKCKPDYLILANDQPLILDFKTAKSSSPWAFRSAVKSYRYDLQDIHYSAGVESEVGAQPRFLFVVVKSEPPYQCRVYELPESENAPEWNRVDKETARMTRRRALEDLAVCYASGDFSDPGEDAITTLYYEDCR